MKYLFVYYSRTGFTERAVHTLKEALSGDISRVLGERAAEALREKQGVETRLIGLRTTRKLGFLRAAWQSLRKRPARIEPIKPPAELAAYDAVILAGPIWASGLCSPLRAFLTGHTGAKKLFVIHTHASEQGYPAVTRELEELAACPCTSVLELCTTRGEAIREQVLAFADTVRG